VAGHPCGRVALFSIHPRYASAILEGTKRVEFRRQALPGDVSHVIIYATSPLQRVVGSFEVEGVDAIPPREAWSKYREIGGIAKDDFDLYYAGATHAHVIRILAAHAIRQPFALTEIDDELRPPQSYLYLRGTQLEQTNWLLHARRSPASSPQSARATAQPVLA